MSRIPYLHSLSLAAKLCAIGLTACLLATWLSFSARSTVMVVLALFAASAGFTWAAAAVASVCSGAALIIGRAGSPLPFELLFVPAVAVLAVCFACYGRLAEPAPGTSPPLNLCKGFWWLLRWVLLVGGIASLASLLLRSVHVPSRFSWAILYLLLYWQTRPAHDGRRYSLRDLPLAGIGVGLLTLLAMPFVAEGLARVVLPRAPAPGELFEPHPEYFFLNKPGAVANISVDLSPKERFFVTYTMSSLGLRDREYAPKTPDEFRILMLGDSFTVGHTTPLEYTIPKRLERLLGEVPANRTFHVINGGCGASGPLQALGMLRERGLSLKPDLVIHQLFPQNDIENSVIGTEIHLRACNQRFYQRMYNLQHQDTFPVWGDQWLRNHSRLYRELWRVSGFRNLFTEFLHGCRLYPAFAGFDPPPSENRPFDLEVNLREWYPELEKAFALLCQYELEIRDECRRAGIDFMAYCIPDFRDLDNALRDPEYQWIKNAPQYEPGKAVRLVERFLESSEVPHVSVKEALAAWPTIDEMYFRFDCHLTQQGNELVARLIRDFLLREYLGQKGLLLSAETPASKQPPGAP